MYGKREEEEEERKTAEKAGENVRSRERKEESERSRGTGRYAPRNILEYLRNLVAGH